MIFSFGTVAAITRKHFFPAALQGRATAHSSASFTCHIMKVPLEVCPMQHEMPRVDYSVDGMRHVLLIISLPHFEAGALQRRGGIIRLDPSD